MSILDLSCSGPLSKFLFVFEEVYWFFLSLEKEDAKNSSCLFCFNRMDGVGILLKSPSVCFV